VFHARDGDVMIAAANDGLFRRLCAAIGLPELAADPRFTTNPQRLELREELAGLIQARLASKAVDDVLTRLADAGVPAAPVNNVGQVAEHAQTAALGLIQHSPEPTVAFPLSFDRERVSHRSAPPRLGEHTAEILRELGYADDELERLAAERIVSGVKSNE
jgi:glutaryl-CoA transferase